MFLGDSGALLIGFLLGSGGIMFVGLAESGNASIPVGILVLVPLMVSFVPLADVVLSVARRFLANQPIFGADRGHVHHRLLDAGLTRRSAVVVLYCWAATGAALAVAAVTPALGQWQMFTAFGFFTLVLVGVRLLRYSEFTMAQRLLFGGEFRKVIARKERIRNLAVALQRAESEDEAWVLLVETGRKAGWAEMVWMVGQSVHRKESFPVQAQAGWAFNLSLPCADSSQASSLNIQGPFQSEDPPFDIMDFAQAVSGAFAVRHQKWQRQGIS